MSTAKLTGDLAAAAAPLQLARVLITSSGHIMLDGKIAGPILGQLGEFWGRLPELEAMRHRANPKRHDIPRIVASIKRYGFVIPPCVCSTSRVLTAGHGRLEALRALRDAGEGAPRGIQVDEATGEWLVPVRLYPFRDERERDDYLIADNKLTEAGGWDDDELRRYFAGRGPDLLDSVGYSLDEYNKLMSGFRVRPAKDADEAPPLPKTPVSRVGELWTCGEHRLAIGDSTDAAVLARALDGAQAQIAWTDPPYNIEVVGGHRELPAHERKKRGGKVIANDALGVNFGPFMEQVSDRCWTSLVPGGALYVAMSSREWPLVDDALRRRGFHWASSIIWAKDSFILSNSDYHPQYEAIWYGWRGDAARIRPAAARDVGDVWQIPRPRANKDHPTQKPVDLVVRSLHHTSRHGDLVLDPFGGSGTTMIAAEQTGRRAALVELDPCYADVIIQRFEEYSGKKAVRS
jgi:DNA modification methylase